MYKLIIKLSIAFIILVIGVFSLIKLNILPNFLDISKYFIPKETSIEPSALIIENVTPLAQLFSSTYYSEFPITEIKKTDAFFGLTKTDNELILIAKGNCYAGTDLSKLSKDDIQITDSVSCTISLPSAEFLDVVMNPTDFEIYKEDGEWSSEEVKKLKEKAKDEIKEMAIKDEVLKKADERSIQMFTDLLKSLGYKNVIVAIKSRVNSINS
jgi:hypothetical protein